MKRRTWLLKRLYGGVSSQKLSIVAYSLSNCPVRNSRFMEPAAGGMLVISLIIPFFAIIAVSCWHHIFCK